MDMSPANSNVLIQRVSCLDINTMREVVCSVVVSGVMLFFSLSWSRCCLCGCHPPTHLCPSKALQPRVHLASSYVSVELSPLTAATDSLNVPALYSQIYFTEALNAVYLTEGFTLTIYLYIRSLKHNNLSHNYTAPPLL